MRILRLQEHCIILALPYGRKLNQGNSVSKQFGQHAEKYRKSVTHGNKTVLDNIVELISPGSEEIALDVGCGGGHMAVAIASRVQDVVAVDVTPEMLSQTSLLAAENGLFNIVTCLCDTRHLPFRDEIFNVVTCRIVVHHVPEPGRAVTEMSRVTKKRGKVFIQDILGSESQEARDYMDLVERLRDPSHIKNYNVAEWDGLIAEAGLGVTHMEIMPGVYGLKDWTTRSGTSLQRIEEITRMLERMPQRVSNHLKASYSDGDWSVQMRYILILATKEP
jgi:ubiquinone/menaquinone biosynthesis C-methylase UbiE